MGMAATSDRPATRRFTADEVWRMVEIGLLDPDEPYELINGELLYVSPQNQPHVNAIVELNAHLGHRYGLEYRVMVQGPVGGIVDSIPEPDLVVFPRTVAADDRPVRADELLLLIEVSGTSVRHDIDKAAIYAAAGAPEYWRVDLNERIVHVHRHPQAGGNWRETHQIGLAGMLTLPGIEATIAVSDILAPRRSPTP